MEETRFFRMRHQLAVKNRVSDNYPPVVLPEGVMVGEGVGVGVSGDKMMKLYLVITHCPFR
jgi:hypothetical protein